MHKQVVETGFIVTNLRATEEAWMYLQSQDRHLTNLPLNETAGNVEALRPKVPVLDILQRSGP
jgi:hypothetical protein